MSVTGKLRASAILLVITLAYVLATAACTDADTPTVRVDADQPDADTDAAADADVDTAAVATRLDTGPTDGAWTPPEHIATCSELLDCHSRCRADPDCIDACDGAATAEARTQEQALVSCINSAGCSNQHCIMENCGHHMNACFGQ